MYKQDALFVRTVAGAVQSVAKLDRKTKIAVAAAYDFMVCALVGIALGAYGSTGSDAWLHVVANGSVAAALAVSCIGLLGGYSPVIRFIPTGSVLSFGVGIVAGDLLFLLLAARGVGSNTGIVYLLLALGLSFGARLGLRSVANRLSQRQFSPVPTVIYGAGTTGRDLAKGLTENRNFRAVAFIDDDKSLHGRSVANLKVYAPADLESLRERLGVREVILALPSICKKRRRELLAFLLEQKVRVQTVPPVDEILSGQHRVQQIQPVDIIELLGRERVIPDQRLLKQNIEGKSILITGAGGTIGSELVHTIAKQRPKAMILVDNCEYALFGIDLAVRERLKTYSSSSETIVVPVLGSAEDEMLMLKTITGFQIDTIFHAAAYKHVPLVEINPTEGVRNNVRSTQALLNAVQKSTVKNFVLISSDKAVRPTNVMGASKRVSELLVQAAAEINKNCKMTIVRFGNVLGSSGSVLPQFQAQLGKGGPLKVTHRDVTRFFMTISEAAELVVQASALDGHGSVFHLDMGEPIRVLDLAKQFLLLHGLRPRLDGFDGDIDIEIVGLRPGEKLYEELLIDNTALPTAHAQIYNALERSLPYRQLAPLVHRLLAACAARDDHTMIAILCELVEGFSTNNSRAAAHAVPARSVATLRIVDGSASSHALAS